MKYLFAIFALLLPLYVQASSPACNCDEEDDEDEETIEVPVYRAYNYVGVKGGSSNIYDPNINLNAENAYGIYFGRRSSKIFAVELEYSNLGRVVSNNGTGYASAISLGGVHQIDLGGMDLLLRLGIARTSVSDGFSSQGGFAEMFGAGLESRLNKDLLFRLGYDKYRLAGLTTSSYATFGYVGFSYKY